MSKKSCGQKQSICQEQTCTKGNFKGVLQREKKWSLVKINNDNKNRESGGGWLIIKYLEVPILSSKCQLKILGNIYLVVTTAGIVLGIFTLLTHVTTTITIWGRY